MNHFRERPLSNNAWWTMGLGLGALFVFPALGIFAAFIRPLIDRSAGEGVGMVSGFGMFLLTLSFSISALVVGIKTYRSGERSWAMWAGLVPATLVAAFWVFMVAGELLFPH